MGIDVLDIMFRIEKRFGIRIVGADWTDLVGKRSPPDITAGELWFLVAAKLHEAHLPVPRSCWNAVRVILSQALRVPPREIKKESWLIRELGMT
jgi:hypothetical protein